MKYPYVRLITICTCCLLLVAGFAAFKQLPVVTSAASPVVQAAPELTLSEAENQLASRRLELAELLRAYELGRAGEKETARLIAEVEKLRLTVEALRAAAQP